MMHNWLIVSARFILPTLYTNKRRALPRLYLRNLPRVTLLARMTTATKLHAASFEPHYLVASSPYPRIHTRSDLKITRP
jgi:hypothetical protein